MTLNEFELTVKRKITYKKYNLKRRQPKKENDLKEDYLKARRPYRKTN